MGAALPPEFVGMLNVAGDGRSCREERWRRPASLPLSPVAPRGRLEVDLQAGPACQWPSLQATLASGGVL